MKRRLSKHAGFTLVELLVPIGITGLLVGLWMPTAQAARRIHPNIAFVVADDLGCYGLIVVLISTLSQTRDFQLSSTLRPFTSRGG